MLRQVIHYIILSLIITFTFPSYAVDEVSEIEKAIQEQLLKMQVLQNQVQEAKKTQNERKKINLLISKINKKLTAEEKSLYKQQQELEDTKKNTMPKGKK